MNNPVRIDVRDLTVTYPNGLVALRDTTFALAGQLRCILCLYNVA